MPVYALVLQVGDWTKAYDVILLNKLLRNPEKWKPDGLIKDKYGRTFWETLMAQN
jgi:hypothetical protein